MTRKQPATTKPRSVDLVVEAGDHARTLGHTTCRRGRTFDCWRCDADGVVGPDGARIGTIFEEKYK